MKSVSTAKLFITYLSVLAFVFVLIFALNTVLAANGVPFIIYGIFSFFMGMVLPKRILTWIYKEELEADRLEESVNKE